MQAMSISDNSNQLSSNISNSAKGKPISETPFLHNENQKRRANTNLAELQTMIEGASPKNKSTTISHSACGHEVNITDIFDLVGLGGGNDSSIIKTGNPHHSLIIEPRWCSACVLFRSIALADNVRRRFSGEIPLHSAESQRSRIRRAAEEGLLQGRIAALSRPLNRQDEAQLHVSTVEFDNLADEFVNLSSNRGWVQVIEEERNRMLKMAFDGGYAEGMGLQLRMEKGAMDEMDANCRMHEMGMCLW